MLFDALAAFAKKVRPEHVFKTRFDQRPNHIVAVQMLEVEIRRMKISLPGRAATSVGDGNSAHINTMGRIIGGDGAGIFYPAGTGTPTIGPPNADRVTGTPPLSPSGSYLGDAVSVFGVDAEAVRAMATDVVTTAAAFPSPISTNGLLYAEAPTITFDRDLPLRGTGVVYIKGNVRLLPGNGSDFSGLLYIDGNLTARAPCELAGAVIVTGNMTLQGATEYATIRFDENVLDMLRQVVGQYRWHGTIRPVLSTE